VNPLSAAKKYFSLARDERRLVEEAIVVLGATRVMLWTLPLKRLNSIAESMGRARVSPDRAGSRETIVRAVERASNAIPAANNCLVRAIAAQIMLARRGIDAELKIGVAHPSDGFKAHAWLECAGEVVIGDFAPGEYFTLGRVG
jgi:hypothetical protein